MPGHNSTLLYFALTFKITILTGKKKDTYITIKGDYGI